MSDSIFEYLIDNPFIETKKLKELGCDYKEINELIDLGILKREKKGIYVLADVETLYHYGKRIITEGRYERGQQCFLKCYEICPSHPGVCFQFFLNAIKDKKYSEAFNYFDNVFSTDNENYLIDARIYLLLLSELTELPEKYQRYVERLQYDDIRVLKDDKRYPDQILTNKMRLAIYNKKYSYALNQLNSVVAARESKRPGVQDLLMKTLLIQNINIEKEFKDSVFNYCSTREYYKMAELFREKERSNGLKDSEKLCLRLIEVILQMIESKSLVEINAIETTDFHYAINSGDYISALRLNKEYNEKNNIDSSKSLVTLLLTNIVDLINKIMNENDIPNEEKKDSVENSLNTNVNLGDLLKSLINQDNESSIIILRKYLKNVDRAKYEFLITNLIKISILEKDFAFVKPMTVLSYIIMDNFVFDISPYISGFYMCLAENQHSKAEIYLDIISSSNKFMENKIPTSELKLILELSKKTLVKRTNEELVSKFEQTLETSKTDTEKSSISTIKQEPVVVYISKKEDEIKAQKEVDSNFDGFTKSIESKISEAIDTKDVIILPCKTKEAEIKIRNLLSKREDIDWFIVGEGNNRILVLKYKEIINGWIDFKEMLSNSNREYKYGNYDAAIEMLKKAMAIFRRPKPFVFENIGMAYLRKNDTGQAIKYITIADVMYKEEKNPKDFSDFLLQLKNSIPIDNRKPKTNFTQKDFDIQSMVVVDSVTSSIIEMMKSGISLNDACQSMNLDYTATLFAKIYVATEYYRNGNTIIADRIFKEVENTPNKPSEVNQEVIKLRGRRKFLQHEKDVD